MEQILADRSRIVRGLHLDLIQQPFGAFLGDLDLIQLVLEP